MAHELESMMYAKEVPWHGLGTYVGDNDVNAAEALAAAGLDWNVVRLGIAARRSSLEDGFNLELVATDTVPADGNYALVRDSDCAVLGTCGSRYTVLQNTEAFDFMDSVAGTNGEVRYHTAGSLYGGKKIWILATVKDRQEFDILKGDGLKPYLLLTNAHDGSGCVRALTTSVRVVCNNTLKLALHDAKGEGVALRHTKNMKDKLDNARKALGYFNEEWEKTQEEFRRLARIQLGNEAWNKMLDNLFPLTADRTTRMENIRGEVTECFESGIGSDIPGVKGTAWGALNAITEFTSHHRGTHDHGQGKKETRLNSVWFGSGDKLNQAALKYVRELEGV
jgi:phage/plasmid-like protein (TIGR03299 family)